MSSSRFIPTFAAAVLLLTSANPAHALSRDTGVGRHIAAQGNAALRAIRAELRTAFRATVPSLQAVPKAATKVAAGGALPTAPGARCAE